MKVYTVNHLEVLVSNGRIIAVESGIFRRGLTDRPTALAFAERLAKDKRLRLVLSGAYVKDDIRIEKGKNGFKVCWDDSYDEYAVASITVKGA